MNLEAKTLGDMAKFDSRIFGLKKRLRTFPKRLEEARRQLVAEEGLLREVDGPWTELEEKILAKEATIQVALETISKFEEHIKRVTTQKEFMAAKKQVEEARKLNEQLQNEILENRVKQEELAPRLTELRDRYEKVSAAYKDTESDILGEKGKLEKETVKEEKGLRRLFEPVAEQVWDYYQKLLHSGKTPGIVPVTGGMCGGCNMAIPPQSYNLLIADPDKLHTCSHCARIIFYQPAEEPSEEGAEPVKAKKAGAPKGKKAEQVISEQPALAAAGAGT